MTRLKMMLALCCVLMLASIGGCGEDEPEQSDDSGDDDDSSDDDDDDGDATGADASSGPSRDGSMMSSRDGSSATSRDGSLSSGSDAATSRDAGTPIDAARSSGDGGGEAARDATSSSSADGAAVADSAAASAFSLSSSVVQNGMRLANEHRCADMRNDNVSPPLSWTEGPSGTLSYALIMRDTTSARVVLHWTLYDLPPSATSLPAGVPAGYEPAQLNGAKQGPSYKTALGYQGPCAPSGTNTYEFTLYALSVATVPGLTQSSTAAQIVAAIEMHDLASAKLTVTSSPM